MVNERQKNQSRRNAAIYSESLRELRDRYPQEFESIWSEKKGGEPRLRIAKVNGPARGIRRCPVCRERRPKRAFPEISGPGVTKCVYCYDRDDCAPFVELIEDFAVWLKGPLK